MEKKSETGLIVGLIVVVALCFIVGGNHPGGATTSPQPSSFIAHVTRLYQLDPAQYNSPADYEYAPSACSTTSLTEVLNGYGQHLRIADVLHAEIAANAISPQLGLLDENGLARTARAFGFQATIDHTHTLDQVIALGNKGTPVIVSIPPGRSRKFPGGHILVATGGNAQSVFLADSSSYNLGTLSRTQFQALWSGLTALVTPTTAQAGTIPNYRALAEQDAQEEGISPTTFSRQMNDESGFQADIVSSAGAIGIAQFMPEKARELKIDPHDPVVSLKAAAHLMSIYLKRYDGDYAKALAAYEAGPGAVDRAIRLGGVQWTRYLAASTCRYLHTILNEQVCQ